MTTPSRPDPCP